MNNNGVPALNWMYYFSQAITDSVPVQDSQIETVSVPSPSWVSLAGPRSEKFSGEPEREGRPSTHPLASSSCGG